jgi:crooked neck
LLQDVDRARAIYELAVNQPTMDMPELIWKSWIDFEYEEEEYERTRDLYERLLRRTSHVKVWVSFAQFEANAGAAAAEALAGGGEEEDEEGGEGAMKVEVDQAAVEQAKQEGLERARQVFERGYADLKKKMLKEEVSRRLSFPFLRAVPDADRPCLCVLRRNQRVVLLEAWKALEAAEGDAASLARVEAMLPRVVKKMRKVDGDASMMEECTCRSFPRGRCWGPLADHFCAAPLYRLRYDLC